MAAKIIKHAEFEDTYDDAEHPIPSLSVIEVYGILKGGGARLGIVIAKPLMADEYSQNRLLDKIEGYLRFINSQEFNEECGAPTPDNTVIVVRIHRESDPIVFDLLNRSKSWVTENNASLDVTLLND